MREICQSEDRLFVQRSEPGTSQMQSRGALECGVRSSVFTFSGRLFDAKKKMIFIPLCQYLYMQPLLTIKKN
jgi:hypothetical protein